VGFDVRGNEAGSQSVAAVKAEDFVVKPAGKIAIENNQWFVGDIVHAKRAALGQAMLFGDDDDEFFFVNQFAVQSHVVERRAQEADVDFVLAQGIILKIGEDVATLDFDPRPALAELEYHLADNAPETGSDADLDHSGFAALRLACRLDGMAGLDKEFSSLLEKRVARLGEFDVTLVARKQIDAETFFELAYLAAQWRLSDVQALRGLTEVQVFRHCDEIPDVTQFHGEAFYIRYAMAAMSILKVPSKRIRALIPRTYQARTKDVLDSSAVSHHALPSC
jgi:hypothetical protein